MKEPEIVNAHLEGGSFHWPGGPVGVLLSHGYTATTTEVRLLGKALHEQGYTVAGPLLPGHGTTVAEMNRCRWQDWAVALEEVYQRLARDCRRVVVGGESLGALLAVYTASRHPEAAGILTFAPALRTRQRLLKLAPLVAPFIPYVARRPGPPTVVDGRWKGYPVQPVAAAAQVLWLQHQVRSRLAELRQPLLIVQGRLDATVDPRGAEELYRRAGSAIKELHWMERSTHCVLLDQELPEVTRITLHFLERAVDDARP